LINDPLLAVLLSFILGLIIALLFTYNWAKPFFDTFMIVVSVSSFSLGIWQLFRKK
jgi:ABC-type sugar transport system permease subunit